jgi:alkylation response protein AidB-like acyl-CoA dehydrogenase
VRYLQPERNACARFLPGLEDALARLPPAERERPGGPALGLFRECGGPGPLIPAEHGGLGATPLDALRVQRAVGSRSPSLAVATTMHHFSVAGSPGRRRGPRRLPRRRTAHAGLTAASRCREPSGTGRVFVGRISNPSALKRTDFQSVPRTRLAGPTG